MLIYTFKEKNKSDFFFFHRFEGTVQPKIRHTSILLSAVLFVNLDLFFFFFLATEISALASNVMDLEFELIRGPSPRG